jgi:hypothetical protein
MLRLSAVRTGLTGTGMAGRLGYRWPSWPDHRLAGAPEQPPAGAIGLRLLAPTTPASTAPASRDILALADRSRARARAACYVSGTARAC